MICPDCAFEPGFIVSRCPRCGARLGARTQTGRATHHADGPAEAYLFVRAGPDKGMKISLRGTTTLGRSAACRAVLADRRISDAHARIKQVDGEFIYLDELSSNRSFLRTPAGEVELTTPHRLLDGDSIRLGRTVIQFIDTRKEGSS